MTILALGGSTRMNSTSGGTLRLCAETFVSWGRFVTVFNSADLARVPYYTDKWPDPPEPVLEDLIAAYQAADGIVISSPVYQSSFSGLVKNALDWVHKLPVLLDDLPIAVFTVGTSIGQARLAGHMLLNVTKSMRRVGDCVGPVCLSEDSFDSRGNCSDRLARTAVAVALGDLISLIDGRQALVDAVQDLHR